MKIAVQDIIKLIFQLCFDRDIYGLLSSKVKGVVK